MGGSTDDWDQSDIFISHGQGEIQIDTGSHDGIWESAVKRFNGLQRFVESQRGLLDKAARNAKESQLRKGQPPVPPAPLKPNKSVTSAPPEETARIVEDLPQLQGAPDIVSLPDDVFVLRTEGQSSQPLPSREAPSHTVADQSNPIPAQEAASLIFPPPADFESAVRDMLQNKPVLGEPHPTHAAPAARRPATDADPVDLFTGAFTINVVDLVVPTAHIPIVMSRSYRSGRPYYGPFGFGWDHTYNVYLRELNDGRVAFWSGQLCEQHFRSAGGEYEPEPGLTARLERIPGLANRYVIHFPGGQVWSFESPAGWGDLQRIPLNTINDRHGNAVHLSYDANDRLVSVLDTAGRGLLFHYGNCELLEQVTDHTESRIIQYWHDDEVEHLVRVVLPATGQYPTGLTTTYEYDSYATHPAMQHNILRIHDAEDRLMVENEFAGPEAGWEFNSVVRQRLAGFEYQFEYQQIQYVWPDPIYTDVLATRTLVRRPDGSLHTYTFNYRGDLLDHRFRLIRDGSFRVIAFQNEYDAEGNLIRLVAPDGLQQIFTYDSTNADPCARRNLLRVELAAPLSSLVTSRIIFQGYYEPRYQLMTKTIDEAGAVTRFKYDFDINPVGASGRLDRIQLPAVIGADEVPQQSELLLSHNVQGQLTRMIKPEGGQTELTYNSGGIYDGFLAEIMGGPAGAQFVTKIKYDTMGFPSQIDAPGGRIKGFMTNALGQIEHIVAPIVDGQTAQVHRWFDDSGSIVRVARPAGSFATGLIQGSSIIDEYERDETGNLRCVILAGNTKNKREMLQRVDHEGHAISMWDALGTRIDRVFSEDGRLLSETVAAGDSLAETTSYIYDSAGRVSRVTGPWKDVTVFHPDIWGRIHRITLPNGAVRTLELGANDQVLEERVEEITDGVAKPLQRRTYEYDKRGRLISETAWSFRNDIAVSVPLKTRYLYDRDDNMRAVLLPRGAQYRYEFDNIGRLSQTTDPFGNVRQFVYDSSGDLSKLISIEVENGEPRVTTRHNTYDLRGRLKHSEYLGTVATMQYDDRDLLIEQRAPSGVINRLQYNALGQIVENLIDPTGIALRSQFEYDLNGRLHRYIDPTGQSTTWERDALGRAFAIKPPDGSTWEFMTDTKARTIEQRMPSGNRVLLEYAEDESRPVKMVCVAALGQESVSPHELTYDGMRRLVLASVGADSVLRRYDSLDRLIEETTRGKTVRMEYDDANGSKDLVFPDGRRERTEQNPSGQPTRIVLVTPGDLGGTPGEVLLEIIYSTAGRPVRVIYGNGVEGQLVYDDQDRVIRIEYQKSGIMLDSCRLRYDEGGHRAIIQYLGAPARNLVHRFDSNERLVEARSGFLLAPLPDVTGQVAQSADVAAARITAAAAPGVTFSLDDADVRTKITGLNGGAADESYISSYDHRITGVGASIISYDPDGTRKADGRYTYELDALNRVRRVRDRGTNAIVAELRYDPLSRVAAGATDGQEFERWFAGYTRIHEVSGLGLGSPRQHSLHPLWSSPFYVVDATGPSYIHQDEGWSTLCVTDPTGSVLERHRYDVFGKSQTFAADGLTLLASLKTERMWRGMPELGTTTLYRTPQRLYDPEIGMFTSRDPLLYADSPSPYAYAAHNPVDFADPTGLAKSPIGEYSGSRTGLSKWFYEDSMKVFRTPSHKADFLYENGPVDSGSTLKNYAFNSWRSLSNLLASLINTPFEMLSDLDEAMTASRFGVEWQGPIRYMFPLMKGMGLAIETAGTLTYTRGLLSWAGGWTTAAGKSIALGASGIGWGGLLLPPRKASTLGPIGTATTRASFRELVIQEVSPSNHPLRVIINPATGRLWSSTSRGITAQVWFDNPEILEAGHIRSAKILVGGGDQFAMMSAHHNRLLSSILEHPSKGGAMLDAGIVLDMANVPMDLQTAVDLVAKYPFLVQIAANARRIIY